MSSFKFPTSSSPPSTPQGKNGGRQFSFGLSNPSTTPAGPPPSSAGSFTPAGLPPSSVLGSSRNESFGIHRLPPLNLKEKTSKPANPSGLKKSHSTSAPKGFTANFSEDEEDLDDADGEYYNEDYDGSLSRGQHDADSMSEDDGADDVSITRKEPNGKELAIADFRQSVNSSRLRTPREFSYGAIANDISNRLQPAPVTESGDLIAGTEHLVLQIYQAAIKISQEDDSIQEALTSYSDQLLTLWSEYDGSTKVPVSQEYTATIGPGPGSTSFASANFLAHLLLRLHHARHINGSQNLLGRSQSFRGSTLSVGKGKQIPSVLLEWMDGYHDPYPTQLEEVRSHKPSPAHHRLFWDTILNSLLRGRVMAVVATLKAAGWQHARVDDPHDVNQAHTPGALAVIVKVVGDAINALQMCPAISGDWDTSSREWTLFRRRIEQIRNNLKIFAEGSAEDRFGAASLSKSYTAIARKAESQVPWDIYQNILTMYRLVLGEHDCIVENAQDWCESAVGLLIWWNPTNEEGLIPNLSHNEANSPATSSETYLRRLADSFYRTTSDKTDFEVNTLNFVEVGLACIFEGDYESAIALLQSWSGPISSATAEIGSLGAWLQQPEGVDLAGMEILDQEDMDLLGFGGSVTSVKDRTLILYADALKKLGKIKSASSKYWQDRTVQGWELAIAILGRLDSLSKSEEEVAKMLRDLHLESSDMIDRLWKLLIDLSMTNHAEDVAQEWADHLAEETFRYGEALWYYALAHKSAKIKDVLDLLISLSLIHSVAFPPESELDAFLKRMILDPGMALAELSALDDRAAVLLRKNLSGYATLRHFYDVRDQNVYCLPSQARKLGDVVRKSDAFSALLALINSSDENIRGGLYDASRDSVIGVDFILALLGEAMVFVNQVDILITAPQITVLLKAIEDVQTVSINIYTTCDEFLNTVISSASGLKGSSPMDMLRKSTSNISGTSSFSMVGSSMLASQLQRSIGSSGVLVKGNIKRGWDWRQALSAGTTSQDILHIMRFGLAKDLAKLWLAEADGHANV